jgi:toxin-antitoxin system PIN domain toxin
MHLLDINVWLALAFAAHAQHQSARLWFDALPESARCYFCRFTQQGFLRLANNRQVFPQTAVTQIEAWRLLDAFLTDPCVEFADEPQGLETIWRQFTQHSQFSTQQWSDAYLASFAIVGGHEIVTFDRGFAQYAGAKVTLLK